MKASVAFVIAVVACGLVDVHSQDVESSLHSIGGKRLVGGERSLYTVQLRLSGNRTQGTLPKLCSGIRVSPDWILTSADCLESRFYRDLYITVPDNNGTRTLRHEIGGGPDTVQKDLRIIIHGNYNSRTKAYNLALIKTNLPSVSNVTGAPQLPSYRDGSKDFIGVTSVVSSYENTSRNGQVRDGANIASLNVTIVKSTGCERFIPRFADKEDFICVSSSPDVELTKDDIGAPLVITNKQSGIKKLIGILSIVGPKLRNKSQRVLFTSIIQNVNWVSFFTHLPIGKED